MHSHTPLDWTCSNNDMKNTLFPGQDMNLPNVHLTSGIKVSYMLRFRIKFTED